jgi:hypothetical protein
MAPSAPKASATGEKPTPTAAAASKAARGTTFTSGAPALFTQVIATQRIPCSASFAVMGAAGTDTGPASV